MLGILLSGGLVPRIKLTRSRVSPIYSEQVYGLSLLTPKRMLSIQIENIRPSSSSESGGSKSPRSTKTESRSTSRSTDLYAVYDDAIKSGKKETPYLSAQSTPSPSNLSTIGGRADQGVSYEDEHLAF